MEMQAMETVLRRRTFIAGAALAAPSLATMAQAADDTIARRFAEPLSAHDIDAFAEDYGNHQVSAAAGPG